MSRRSKSFLAILFVFVGISAIIYYYNVIAKTQEMHDNVREILTYVKETIGYSARLDNYHWLYHKYQRKLCDLDKQSIDKLSKYSTREDQEFKNLKAIRYVNDFFHGFIQNPHISFCKEIKRFGGEYKSFCKYFDGQKFVCMDSLIQDITRSECLIYSFGVANDWSFEDVMDDLGCKVYAFDGTVNHPKRRGKNIYFEKIFIGSENNEIKNTQTIPTILARYGHTNTTISYLKTDIEGYEMQVLPQALDEGTLRNVQQIGMEFHKVDDAKKTDFFIRLLRRLYLEGNYRLISYDVNACNRNLMKRTGGYYNLAEIVLLKVSNNNNCV